MANFGNSTDVPEECMGNNNCGSQNSWGLSAAVNASVSRTALPACLWLGAAVASDTSGVRGNDLQGGIVAMSLKYQSQLRKSAAWDGRWARRSSWRNSTSLHSDGFGRLLAALACCREALNLSQSFAAYHSLQSTAKAILTSLACKTPTAKAWN